MNFNSLQWRMTISMIVIQVLAIVVLSYESLEEYAETLFGGQDQILNSIAQDITVALDLPSNELTDRIQSLVLVPIRTRHEHRNASRPVIFRVWKDGQDDNIAISKTNEPILDRWLYEFKLPANKRKKGWFIADFEQEDWEYRLMFFRPRTHGNVNIIVGIDNSETREEIGELIAFVFVVGGIVIIVTSIVIRLIIPRILLPIKRTSQVLQNVSVNNMSTDSLEEMRIPSELHTFVDSVKNMLLRLNDAIKQQKQFSADASHELRTPLATAKSTLQTAQIRKRTNEEYQITITESLDDVIRMEKLIEQLMIQAHLDSIENKNQMTSVNLDSLIVEVVDKIKDHHKTDRIKIRDMHGFTIRAYTDEMSRMFYNIIDNALVYGPSDKPVTISMQCTDKQTSITVHDHGGNIPAEHIEKLCDRFYRVDDARSRDTGGSGLGLAIAKTIAHRHGGTVKIKSNPELGTTVTVILDNNLRNIHFK